MAMKTVLITKEQLEIFKKYSGDIDWVYRLKDERAKTLFDDNDSWHTINILVQDILLIDKNLVSEEYKSKVLSDIVCKVSKDDIDLLYKIARIISTHG